MISVRGVSVEFPLLDRPFLTGHLFGRRHAGPARSVPALRNLSVEIGSGESVGLIGHNGAGKSTFLRTVAGIYPPVRGEVVTQGDVRCLFQVGAGLNPDATGYENVPLLAAANQIPLATVPDLVREVEAFTGLGSALDRPLRTYSSGMRLRLAFAVATARRSDVLLMDEVIGVGDRDFREKALERIGSVMEQAGTLLLASHSEAYIKTYCRRGLVFMHGRIVFDGPVEEALAFSKSPDRMREAYRRLDSGEGGTGPAAPA